MSDQHINCSECGASFVFTESERQFYETKGLSGPPKRCKTCRLARKAADPGRAGGFRGGNDARGPSRGAPSGGFGGRPYDRPRGPGAGAPSTGNAPRAGGWGRVGGGEAPRAPRFNDGAAQRPGGDRPGNDRPGGRTFTERGPARGENGFGRGGPAARGGPSAYDGPPRGNHGPRPDRASYGNRQGGNDGPKRPARADARTHDKGPPQPVSTDPAQTRPKKAKPDRPKFDVTCQECGTAAQVPFKPIEGRDVFCQPCYRARRGIAAPTTEPNLDGAAPAVLDAADAPAITGAVTALAPSSSAD